MALWGLIKTNKEAILETIEKNKNKFQTLKFNDNIVTFNKENFEKVGNYYLENNKKNKELEKIINKKLKNNEYIYYCTHEINNLIIKYPKLKKEINEFKLMFKTIDDLQTRFESHIKQIKLNGKILTEVNNKVEQFNFELENPEKFVEKIELKKIFSKELKNDIAKIKAYILINNRLLAFYNAKAYNPVLGNEKEVKEICNIFNKINFNNFNKNIYRKILAYQDVMSKQIDASEKYSEYLKNIREEISDFKMKISINLVLDDLMKFNFNKLTEDYESNLKKYNNRVEKYTILLEELVVLENEVKIKVKDYNKILSMLDGVLHQMNIKKKEEIEDVNDYFLYSIVKNIEKRQNVYGSSKNIKRMEIEYLIMLVTKLLYKLTSDQLNAIYKSVEILNAKYPASCLIQGDVSSGKTIVTVVLMFIMALKKKKSIYIVPRLILRQQHLRTLKKYNELFNLNLKIYDMNEDFDIREADIVLSGYSMSDPRLDVVDFELGIVDEIQLFGVEQRNQVQKKYPNIDMFYTTATPHPRTKLISLIGNMDIIEIKELPPGRKLKNTYVFEKFNEEIINRIKIEIKKQQAILVVCPLVNPIGEGEFENVKVAYKKYKEIFKEANVSLMLASYGDERKDEIINEVINGKVNILVTTKVIEVGVDIPNASTIIIHYPYKQKIKWGVSQLHQLRGRVGRNNQDAYCYIESNGIPEEGSPIDSVLKTQDVFELTKNDFNWRGFHKIIGTKQSGTKSTKNLEQKVKAYEKIANQTPNLINQLEKNFLNGLEQEVLKKRIENLN